MGGLLIICISWVGAYTRGGAFSNSRIYGSINEFIIIFFTLSPINLAILFKEFHCLAAFLQILLI